MSNKWVVLGNYWKTYKLLYHNNYNFQLYISINNKNKEKHMAHWGWYWKVKLKHNPKTLCSTLPSIDSFVLFKNNTQRYFKIPDYQLTAVPSNDCFPVTYGKNKQHSYVIPFEKQSCNYGGFRYYFNCPLCKKRMRKLYFTHGVFLCRNCLNLGYPSQRKRTSIRNMSLTGKIEETLEIKGGSLDKKPKWMKRVTFERLRDKHSEYDAKWEDANHKELLEWYPNRRDQIEMLC